MKTYSTILMGVAIAIAAIEVRCTRCSCLLVSYMSACCESLPVIVSTHRQVALIGACKPPMIEFICQMIHIV